MDSLIIKGDRVTPTIVLDPENDKFEFFGNSMPENVASFYEPVFKWLDIYAANPKKNMVVNFRMDYFNTASSKVLMDILSKLGEINKQGNKVTINWYYDKDDEDMEYVGEQYSELVDLPFNIKPC